MSFWTKCFVQNHAWGYELVARIRQFRVDWWYSPETFFVGRPSLQFGRWSWVVGRWSMDSGPAARGGTWGHSPPTWDFVPPHLKKKIEGEGGRRSNWLCMLLFNTWMCRQTKDTWIIISIHLGCIEPVIPVWLLSPALCVMTVITLSDSLTHTHIHSK